jgi:hypothetical protein
MAQSPDPHELRRLHLAEWETATLPLREDIRNSTEGGIKFAEATTKSLSYINAGGLIALPVVMGLVGANLQSDARWIVSIAGLFVLGLICAIAANVAGFFAMSRLAEADEEALSAATSHIAAAYASITPKQIEEHKKAAGEASTRESEKRTKYNGWRGAGVVFAIISLIIFIAGVTTGGVWFWQKGLNATDRKAEIYDLPVPLHWKGIESADWN